MCDIKYAVSYMHSKVLKGACLWVNAQHYTVEVYNGKIVAWEPTYDESGANIVLSQNLSLVKFANLLEEYH